MRADRLISLLMLLQMRGRLTAQELARELEVSERTIYRDIEALSISGVPVYAESGVGGGVSLVDNYRTTLTGLNADETRALFMLSVPAPLAALGAGQPLKAALLKLSAVLPTGQRDALAARQRVHVDSTPWNPSDEPEPHLQTIHQAVWMNRKLHLTRRVYFAGFIDAQVENDVSPYGLVAKAGAWHVVCACEGRLQAFRVAHITSAQMLDDTFERHPDFDLVSFWDEWCDAVESSHQDFIVTARVAPHFAPIARDYMGNKARVVSQSPAQPDAAGWVMMTLIFNNLYEARERILALGGAIEVLEPPELRYSISDYAEQITRLYRQ